MTIGKASGMGRWPDKYLTLKIGPFGGAASSPKRTIPDFIAASEDPQAEQRVNNGNDG